MEIISRVDAKKRGLIFYFTGKPCKHGHIDYRYTSCKKCKECHRVKDLEYRKNNKTVLAEKTHQRYLKNKNKIKEYHRNLYHSRLEYEKERSKKYYNSNKEKHAARISKNRLARLKRNPIWLTEYDVSYIEDVHINCREAELIFSNIGINIMFEVDHIIPIRGEMVSGLHVPTNLQVLSRSENRSKGNKYDPWEDSPIF